MPCLSLLCVGFLINMNHISPTGSVNTSKVRQALLDQWLASNAGIKQLESADVTMIGEDSMLAAGVTGSVETGGSSDDVDLLRVVYLLQHPGTSFESMVLMLINYLSDTSFVSASQQVIYLFIRFFELLN